MRPINDMKKRLNAAVHRFMESGPPEFTGSHLLPYVSDDAGILESIIDEWEEDGIVVWRRSVDSDHPDKEVVCLAFFPETSIPWPAPLSPKDNEDFVPIDLHGDHRFIAKYPKSQIALVLKYLPEARQV